MTDHLAECESCRRRVEGAISGEAAFFALHDEAFSENGNASEHLTPQLLAEYVDKNLSGESLQMAVDHLSNCEECVLAVDDLRTFRNEIAPSLDREFRPATVPSQASPAKIGWRERFFSLFRTAPVPAFGSAALALLVLGLIVWLVWRSPREQEPYIAVAPTPTIQPSPFTQPSPAPTQIETAPVVAQLNDGGRVLTLDQQGKLSGADDLPPAHRSLITKALSTQRIEKSPELQGLTRPPSSLMGSGDPKDKFSISGPVGDVLLTNEPTFRWTAMEGAKGYVVEVYDPQFNLVASSPQLTDLSWTTTLARGNVYSWQVKAIQESAEVTAPRPPAPQAKFRILDQAKANELARAKRSLGSSHLTLGLLYADAGLLSEAEREFRLLRNANPNSELARNLLRQVQALRKAQ
ncbi:MAG TPA: hypothetical protein VFZ71_09785 [Pyrinomonadaceae bacterium]